MSKRLAFSRYTLEPLRTQATMQQAPSSSVETVAANQVSARNTEIGVLLLLIAFGFFLLKFLQALKAEPQNRQSKSSLMLFRQTPCLSCYYFANNSYVKCAVRPTEVLTAQAVHCSDYCPRYKRQSASGEPAKLPQPSNQTEN